MDFKTLATLGTVVSGLFGAAFALAPGAAQSFYGSNGSDPFTLLLGRYFGGEMLLFTAALWALREVHDEDVQRLAASGMAAGSVIGLAITSLGLGNGALNAMGWSSAAIYLFFALAWGRLALRERAPDDEVSSSQT